MKIFRLFVAFTVAAFALSSEIRAVVPPPDGGYPNFTTAEGQNALHSLTTGAANTALGAYSLFGTSIGSSNTAVGAATLVLNTADQNTATGAAALLLNSMGTQNTADGALALLHNDTGSFNTATGDAALYNNTTGLANTATGATALSGNATGTSNTAVGDSALLNNTTGNENTATGTGALAGNTTDDGNTALGTRAGQTHTAGHDNIYIGRDVSGVSEDFVIRIGYFTGGAGDSACFIAGIDNQPVPNGVPVYVTSDNQLGTSLCSRRFKDDIKPMDNASEAILALKPVTFHYKRKFDPEGVQQFGLVAEDVEKVNPALVVCDKEGKPYTVRYDAVNAMLLNEFLKEQEAFVEDKRKVEKLEATVAQQHKDFEAAVTELKGQIQKVSAQLEVNKAKPQTVLNNQ